MYQRQVTFGEAIKMALQQNYCNFSGRSSRSEFWWFQLFTFLLGVVISFIFGDETSGTMISGLVSLVLFLPNLGIQVRRLHDTGHSGWWWFIALTGIGVFLLIYWYCCDSQRGENQYGQEPNLVFKN